MKTFFDVKKSLAECPPKKLYVDGNLEFVERVVLNITKENGKVVFDPEKQPRTRQGVGRRISRTVTSFTNLGWDHDQPPCIVYWDEKWQTYNCLSGYGRSIAALKCKWETMIFDVVKGSPRALEVLKSTAQPKHAQEPMTKADFVRAVVIAIDGDVVDRESDKDVKAFIKETAPAAKVDDATWLTSVFKQVRSRKSKCKWIQCYDAPFANAWMKEHGHPHEGTDNFKESQRCGYVKSTGWSPHYLTHSKRHLLERDLPTWCHFWIETPFESLDKNSKKTIEHQRLSMWQAFDRAVLQEYAYISKLLRISVDEVQNVITLPYRRGGFLPQIGEPSGAQKWPKETTLVNPDGSVWDYDDERDSKLIYTDKGLDNVFKLQLKG